jgi:hypothetical protein
MKKAFAQNSSGFDWPQRHRDTEVGRVVLNAPQTRFGNYNLGNVLSSSCLATYVFAFTRFCSLIQHFCHDEVRLRLSPTFLLNSAFPVSLRLLVAPKLTWASIKGAIQLQPKATSWVVCIHNIFRSPEWAAQNLGCNAEQAIETEL